MCETNCCKSHHDCFCRKICEIAKLVIIGMIIGSAAGMALMYFYDHDRWMQCKAKKMVSGMKDAAQNVASGIKTTIGIDNKE